MKKFVIYLRWWQKKSFSCKKKTLPAAYQLKVTTKIIEKGYSQ